jgi:hypothetical protein
VGGSNKGSSRSLAALPLHLVEINVVQYQKVPNNKHSNKKNQSKSVLFFHYILLNKSGVLSPPLLTILVQRWNTFGRHISALRGAHRLDYLTDQLADFLYSRIWSQVVWPA